MMKALSNNTRRIALVIMLLILVVIMATCQGHIIGSNKDTSGGPSNQEGLGVAINQENDSIRESQNLMSDCAGCHADHSDGGNWSIGSTYIIVPALTTADSLMKAACQQRSAN